MKKHKIIYDYDNMYLGNGTNISYEMTFEATIFCPMTFESYPLDSHNCYFMLGSYSHYEANVNVKLYFLNFNISNQVSLLDYSPQVYPLPKSMEKYIDREMMTYARAGCLIRLERNIIKYIVNHYIPSGLLVIVSWVSFNVQEKKKNFAIIN